MLTSRLPPSPISSTYFVLLGKALPSLGRDSLFKQALRTVKTEMGMNK